MNWFKKIAYNQKIDLQIDNIGGTQLQSDYIIKALSDKKVVGTLTFSIYKNKIQVGMIEVLPSYQRQGIGSKMVRFMKEHFPNYDIKTGVLSEQGEKLFEPFLRQNAESIRDLQQQKQQIQLKLNSIQKEWKEIYKNKNLSDQDKKRSEELDKIEKKLENKLILIENKLNELV